MEESPKRIIPEPVRAAVRMFVPASTRNALKHSYRNFIFERGMKEFLALPDDAAAGDRLIRRLIYGWGNEGWSTGTEYAQACIDEARRCTGNILECGTGLTTIIVGAAAQRRGGRVWSLEHSPAWAERVRTALRRHGITSVTICDAPLKGYGGYDWYDPPFDQLPPDFSLVICDGPPGMTKGGRYGLVPVMRGRLRSGGIILLDDAGREGEMKVAEQWSADLGVPAELQGDVKPFIRITLPAGGPA